MSEVSRNNKEMDPTAQREFNEYLKQCGNVKDPILLVLRVHLYCEYLMDRIIGACVKRPNRLLRDARLSFFQKIRLIHAFNVLPDDLIDALDGLNSVRNDCAHDLNKEITMRDVDRIGHSFGKQLIKFKRENSNNVLKILNDLTMYVCVGLAFHVNRMELKISKDTHSE